MIHGIKLPLQYYNFSISDGRMVKASISGAVDVGLIPSRVKPMILKLVFTASLCRRRLAGHLFQDRWKGQGRGFIPLPPWPPNCLGQMLTVRDFSQHLVSSSKTIRPNIPRGARCMGHCEMM